MKLSLLLALSMVVLAAPASANIPTAPAASADVTAATPSGDEVLVDGNGCTLVLKARCTEGHVERLVLAGQSWAKAHGRKPIAAQYDVSGGVLTVEIAFDDP